MREVGEMGEIEVHPNLPYLQSSLTHLPHQIKDSAYRACHSVVDDFGGEILPVDAADTRSRAELEEMLGAEFAGVLSLDDYSVYNGYSVQSQHKCLAHLRRHFQKVICLGRGNDPQLGQQFLDLINQAFAQHKKWRETKDTKAYRMCAEDFKLKLNQALNKWSGKAGYAASLLLLSTCHHRNRN